MTAQVPEFLMHRGDQLEMCATPLSDYLGRLRKTVRPKFWWQTTACHRGYIGTWEIDDGKLYLLELEGALETTEGPKEASLATALPWVKDRLAATWVTDTLRCVEGRLINYVHAAFASVYERDRFLMFERGRLVDEYLVLNPPAPVTYRIAADGTRTCIDGTQIGFNRMAWISDQGEIPDPLEGEPLENAWKVWSKPPEGEDGYLVGAWYNRGA